MSGVRSVQGKQLYKRVVRPVLFKLPTEFTHNSTVWLLRQFVVRKAIETVYSSRDVRDPRLHVGIAGLHFPSPVGLAAGFDKNCEILPSMMQLGFGYVVGGTVMLDARVGNPSPRLTRLPKEQALINSLGFPSKGVAKVRHNLKQIRERSKPLVISVSGLTISELVECHAAMEPFADAVELNVSSPNTKAVHAYQDTATFSDLLRQINDYRNKPLFVKLPSYTDSRARSLVLGLVRVAREYGVDGVTVRNSAPVAAPMLSNREGGLSGRSILEDTLQIVQEVRSEAGSGTAINACGGIFSAEDAYRALAAGADTIQLYTALVYEGPSVASNINSGLLRLLQESGISSVSEVTRPSRTHLHKGVPACSSTETTPPA